MRRPDMSDYTVIKWLINELLSPNLFSWLHYNCGRSSLMQSAGHCLYNVGDRIRKPICLSKPLDVFVVQMPKIHQIVEITLWSTRAIVVLN